MELNAALDAAVLAMGHDAVAKFLQEWLKNADAVSENSDSPPDPVRFLQDWTAEMAGHS
jgi:hypothetical protein